MIVELSKPFKYEGKEITEIDLNMEDMNGRELIDAGVESLGLGYDHPIKEYSKGYLASIAAKAAGCTVDMIMALPARDFTLVTIAVQDFLMK